MTASPTPPPLFGSDYIADMLRSLGIQHLAINPGASFRGLHDSIVNRLGNSNPALVLTLHEAQAVAIAHGYAKVTGKPMGVVLHANVGLMNAVMAIYNAWVDRVPMLILGATGAVDAARRRPWIEWIHTSRDQAALIRPFVKWDDQPGSIEAAAESLLRAVSMTLTAPCAPTYICLDVDLQEGALQNAPAMLDPARFSAPALPVIGPTEMVRAVSLLEKSSRPLILVGRYDRSVSAWADRIALADALGAAVLCDQKCGVGFPSNHPAFIGAPAQYPDKRAAALIEQADLILSLDWPDVKGLLSLRADKGAGLPTIIASPDERLHNGWSLDHFSLPEADLRLPVKPETFTAALLPLLTSHTPAQWGLPSAELPEPPSSGPVTLPALAAAFDKIRGNRAVCLTRLTFGLPDAMVRFTHPLDCIGYDGGGGIGSTPGITVGAALALKGSGRLPVAILGDGDLLMGSQALWTAAAERLPALFIVNNNQSFYNDVEHQERVAIHRGRPVENKNTGMAICDPAIDLVGLASSYGCTAFGPVATIEELPGVLDKAFAAAEAGGTVLVDVRTLPPAARG
ncbi:thiamine pyrophosphate-binding protein [Sphingorhabdus sp.]|jgi:acetolactate synthase-1/2/3 large subunit|uniref:thiamine pyrophosphate-binding protein n=1 Tax=Sphingorhabdus sp. TaxID=1902408 RepID=UPI0037C8F057